jgi:hypothetical protein
MMKSCYLTVLLIAASLYPPYLPNSQPDKGWNGIVPLHSTRADVTRLLGKPEGNCLCVYRTPTERVVIDYAEAPCKGPVNGWNVPRDTVLQVRITPISPKTLSQLGLNDIAYVKTREQDTGTTYFTDVRRGIRYSVQDNRVVTIRYAPSSDDGKLRCAGFPPYDGGIADYHPYDSFPAESIEQTYAHLDAFAFQVATSQSAFTAYVVGYAGRISKRGEAKRIGDDARDYLIKKRGIRADRVLAVDGGFREKAQFELYLVPNGMATPTPKPTLTPCEVTLIDN